MWSLLTYMPESHVVPVFCHPYVVKARVRDVLLRYGVEPVDVERLGQICLDMGGMCRVDRKFVIVDLGAGRSAAVPEEQTWAMAEKLRNRLWQTLGGRRWIRTSTHPGALVYLSLPDRDKIVKVLEGLPNLGPAHRADMHALLGRANIGAFLRHGDMH